MISASMTRRAWLAAAGVAAGGALVPTAEAAPAAPIRLALNENPFGPSPRAIRAIRDHLDGLCRYVGAEAEQLTAAASAREAVAADQIVLGEILDALGLHLALDGGPGGEFIYSAPGYTALVDAVAPGGGKVVAVPLDAALENDLPALAAAITPRTRAVYLVNPHNPSGTASEAAAFLDAVAAMARRTLVIVDEAYLEFLPDFAARTAVPLVRQGARVVVFRTFTKLFGLGALSVGYAVAPAELAAELRQAGIGAPHGLNSLALVAAAASLGDGEYVAAVRAKVDAERALWHALFDRLQRRSTAARGNFVFVETGRPHAAFAAAMAGRGIEIGRGFPPLDRWARISIGLPAENARARAAFAEVMAAP